MENKDILLNSQFATLNSKVDALIELLSEEDREKFKTSMTKNLSNIYDKFQSKMSKEEFENFRKLCEDGLFRY